MFLAATNGGTGDHEPKHTIAKPPDLTCFKPKDKLNGDPSSLTHLKHMAN